jgi:hypothetical protein
LLVIVSNVATSTIERKIYKIFEGIKIILKEVIAEIRRSRAKFEPEKSNFDSTLHYRFGSLE